MLNLAFNMVTSGLIIQALVSCKPATLSSIVTATSKRPGRYNVRFDAEILIAPVRRSPLYLRQAGSDAPTVAAYHARRWGISSCITYVRILQATELMGL